MVSSTHPVKLILRQGGSPGDVLVMTAAVRDLQLTQRGRYEIFVDSHFPEIWQNNPHVTPIRIRPHLATVIDCGHPPLLNNCNKHTRHYLESFHHLLADRLGHPVPVTRLAPDLHLTPEEEPNRPSGLEEVPYWVMVGGGKSDVTIKWWPTEYYQRVVDHFQGRIHFVQAGSQEHHHPRLNGVIDRVGVTTLRQFIHLVRHAQGVISPVTMAMHLAAAFGKPCVVIAGGREPIHWEMYPTHQFLHTIGQLPCCLNGGCWKARVNPLNDGQTRQDRNLCLHPHAVGDGEFARCMTMIEPVEVIRAIERHLIPTPIPKDRTKELAMIHSSPRKNALPDILTPETSQARMEAFAAGLSDDPGPDLYQGRGIVIPGGGPKYFPCAWVCIRMLRKLGCTLPIELWHLGDELEGWMRRVVEPYDVRCVDALEVAREHPARILNGWELKAYAILNSRFEQVLFLDADNVPIVDPAFLFDSPEFQSTGAIFWPDYGRLAPERSIWKLTGVPYRNEPEFESGQIVIDKRRCHRPLKLAMWMNEQSDFWYSHIHGDKDTFHMAWRKLDIPYSMPGRSIFSLRGVMCQHDFEGRRIFQHRNMHKFSLISPNRRIPGFYFEQDCLDFLNELHEAMTDPSLTALARRLCSSLWLYRRVGHDERPMRFEEDRTISVGAASCEQNWMLLYGAGEQPTLRIHGRDGVICDLFLQGEGVWKGRWTRYERMPIELSIMPVEPQIQVVPSMEKPTRATQA